GTDDYVSVNDDTNFRTTGDWTRSIWVNSPVAIGGDGTTNDIWTQRTTTNKFLLRIEAAGKWALYYRSTGAGFSSFFIARTEAGVWQNIVAVKSGTSVAVYLDGKKVASAANAENFPNDSHQIYFGSVAGGTAQFLRGLIDEVKIYDYARTEEEIRLDYNAGLATHLGPSGKTCSEDPAGCMDFGLAGHWDMDEGSGSILNDKSGNNNTCSLVNGPVWSKGKTGSALYFDGENDYANCNAAVNDISSVTGTVELWAKADSGVGFPFHSNANVRTYIARGSTAFNVAKGEPAAYISFPSTPIGEWHHLVLAWDNGVFWGYQDGALIDSKSFSNSSVASIVRIGQHASGSVSDSFDGQIDGVKIYNRALSAEEVRYHYNQGKPVAYWAMDEGEGTRAFDVSGNNNTGVLTNGPTWVEGKRGSALSFDGADDYVSCGTDSSLNIADSMTASAWIYPKTLGEGNAGHIISRGGTGGWCFYVLTGNILKLYSGAGIQVTSNANSITLNQWQYATVVYDKQNVRFFVNGVEKGVTAETDSILNTGSCVIGARGVTGDFDFNGYLDEVKVYNYARTAEQIMQDYNAGVATHLK
ncbi:MAG: LamG domain-containing protein, partial [Minisyncoccales bacterium]